LRAVKARSMAFDGMLLSSFSLTPNSLRSPAPRGALTARRPVGLADPYGFEWLRSRPAYWPDMARAQQKSGPRRPAFSVVGFRARLALGELERAAGLGLAVLL